MFFDTFQQRPNPVYLFEKDSIDHNELFNNAKFKATVERTERKIG